MALLRRWLAEPLARSLDVDDPRVIGVRRRIIREKRCLRAIYEDWYAFVREWLPANGGPILETGLSVAAGGERVPPYPSELKGGQIPGETTDPAGGDSGIGLPLPVGEGGGEGTQEFRSVPHPNPLPKERGPAFAPRDGRSASDGAPFNPSKGGAVLEIGSGAGFLRDVVPDLITSEVFAAPEIDVLLDGQHLPFCDQALRAIVMTDVLHHLPRVGCFFSEATRCVRPGGVVVMVEPWVSTWSRLIYGTIHAEPFLPNAPDWNLPPSGPLSGANGALAWIVFARDRERFEREHPEWRIELVRPTLPFRYLVSGGVSVRSLAPNWSFELVRRLEATVDPWRTRWAMFAQIVLIRSARNPLPET